jgi:hypothetical protein
MEKDISDFGLTLVSYRFRLQVGFQPLQIVIAAATELHSKETFIPGLSIDHFGTEWKALSAEAQLDDQLRPGSGCGGGLGNNGTFERQINDLGTPASSSPFISTGDGTFRMTEAVYVKHPTPPGFKTHPFPFASPGILTARDSVPQ